MPAATFVATAVAAELCGYQPYLADINADTWMLEADGPVLRDHPALAKIGVVIPVAPFGRPIPQLPWQAFRDQTGISVIIDGAAMFDVGKAPLEQFFGAVPVVLSLHATKGFRHRRGRRRSLDRLRRYRPSHAGVEPWIFRCARLALAEHQRKDE